MHQDTQYSKCLLATQVFIFQAGVTVVEVDQGLTSISRNRLETEIGSFRLDLLQPWKSSTILTLLFAYISTDMISPHADQQWIVLS